MTSIEPHTASRMNGRAARALLASVLAAYLATPQIATAAPVAAGKGIDVAITAFKELCLRSAPSFAGASAKAKRYGITEFMPLGDATMGMSADHSISIQIEPNRECSVTSPNRPNPTLHEQFLRAVGEFADKTPQTNKAGTPFPGKIKGHPFVFQHDRKGGEAYVILSLEK